jgi:hypothetical protein
VDFDDAAVAGRSLGGFTMGYRGEGLHRSPWVVVKLGIAGA